MPSNQQQREGKILLVDDDPGLLRLLSIRLRAEGYEVVLVNSNPATIMTDPETADATYVEPITVGAVTKILEAERPDAVLPTMGGQTALNCALDLAREGVLEKYGVELIGATRDAIDKAEDRERFDKAMKKIGLETPRAKIVHSMEEAKKVPEEFGFPVIIRPSFTMGGSGGGVRRRPGSHPPPLSALREPVRRRPLKLLPHLRRHTL